MATTNLQVRVTADPTSFMQAMGQVNGALSKADAQARKTSSGFAALGSSLTSVGTGLTLAITAPLVGLGVASIKAAADMEVLSKGLQSVMKSADTAGKEMDKLKVLAKSPGIDLEGAVRGSIRLQTLGRSADSARGLMKELANAIAIAGGGKDDFAEVTRQLVQMESVGKVTKENLDTITERIPQISKIMIDTWGPQSVGDPAKFFEKAGINSSQFIDIIKGKLAEGARAGDTFKNSMENAMQDFNLALVEVGETLKPIAQRLLNEFVAPAIKGISDLAKEFRSLDPTIQTSALVITGFVAALPVAITALGVFLTNLAAVKVAFASMSLAMAGVGTAIATFGSSAVTMISSMAGVSAGTAGATAAIGLFYAGALVAAGSIVYLTNALYDLWKAESKAADAAKMEAASLEMLLDRVRKVHPEIGALEVRYRAGQISAADFGAELLRLAKGMGSTVVPTKAAGDSLEGLGEAVGELTKKMPALAKVTAESEILMRLMAEATQKHASQLDKSADILRHYGTVSIDTALKLAKLEDAQLRLNRVLEDAPQITNGGIQFKDIPKFDGTITGGGDFEEFKRMGENIGEVGMQTKEQYDAMKQAAKDSAKGQTVAMRQVSTAITDLSRGITDVIYEGRKFGDTMKSVAMQSAQSITRLLIEGALAKLATKLLDIGGIMGKVFGGGTGAVMSAAPDVAGGAASAVGGASGGIGGAVAGASSGLMGAVTAIASVGSLISGIVGNFQNMAMNKSLDLIEREVRYSQIHLLHTLNRANEFWPYMKLSWESLLRMEGNGASLAGAGGTIINNNMAGAYLLNDSALDDFIERITRRMKQQGL